MVKSYLSLAYLGRFSTCSSVVYVQYTPSSQIEERRDKTNRKTAGRECHCRNTAVYGKERHAGKDDVA